MKSKKTKNSSEEEIQQQQQQQQRTTTNAFTFIKNRFFISPKSNASSSYYYYDEKSPRASTSSSRRSSLQLTDKLSLDLLDSPSIDSCDDTLSDGINQQSQFSSVSIQQQQQQQQQQLQQLQQHTNPSSAVKEGYLFKKTDFKPFHKQPKLDRGWKLYRVVLRGHKLYLYKPTSESPLRSLFPLTKETINQQLQQHQQHQQQQQQQQAALSFSFSSHSIANSNALQLKHKDALSVKPPHYDFDREAQEVLFATPTTQGTVFMELDQNMQPTHKVQLVITEHEVTCTRLTTTTIHNHQRQWSINSIKLDYTQSSEDEDNDEDDDDDDDDDDVDDVDANELEIEDNVDHDANDDKEESVKKVEEKVEEEEEEEQEEEEESLKDHSSMLDKGHSDTSESSDSNGPLPFSITINDDSVFYFSTIHRELGQAWISHLQQKLNTINHNNTNNQNNTTTMCSHSSSMSSSHISSSFSSSGSSSNNTATITASKDDDNSDDYDIATDTVTTLNHLVKTLLFTTTTTTTDDDEQNFIHVFLTTYHLFTTASQILDELKKIMLLSVTKEHNNSRDQFIGFITIWCQSYGLDIVDDIASGLIALLEDTEIEEKNEQDLQVMQTKELILKTVAKNKQQLDKEEGEGGEEETIDNDDIDDYHHHVLEIENIAAKDRRRDSINMSNLLISGLTPQLFLITDPTAFAEQIYVFHQSQHAKYKNTLVRCLSTYLPTANNSNKKKTAKLNPLLSTPHFLTHLIQNQILIECNKPDDDDDQQQSLLEKEYEKEEDLQRQKMEEMGIFHATSHENRVEIKRKKVKGFLLTRSQLLEHWIRIGCHVLELGDMTGWCAIALAVCSPCITRLRETWKAVDRKLVHVVQTKWVQILVDHKILDHHHHQHLDLLQPIKAGKAEEELELEPEKKSTTMKKQQKAQNKNNQIAHHLGVLLGDVKVLDVDRLKLRHYVSTTSLPYFGMLKQAMDKLKEAFAIHNSGETLMVDFATCRSAYTMLKSQLADWESHYDPVSNWHDFPVVAPIQSFFEHSAFSLDIASSSSTKYLHECSLACEPKLLGQGFNGRKFTSHHPSVNNDHSYFQFPEILDSCQLLDPLSLIVDVTDSSSLSDKKNKAAKSFDHQSIDSLLLDEKLTISSFSSSDQPPTPQVIKKAFHRRRSLSFAPLSQQQQQQQQQRSIDSEKTLLDSLITGQPIKSLAQQSKYMNHTGDVVLTVQQGELTFKATFMLSKSKLKTSLSNDIHHDSPMILVNVKAGHLESLVDLLVYGIGEYTDQLKDQWNVLSNHPLPQTVDNVKMDDEDYVTVFFSSYRAFCSSHQLLDMLRKRFLSSKDQGKRAQRKNSLALLENYFQNNNNNNNLQQQKESSKFLKMDWERVGQIQLRILNLMYYWLEEHDYDFMDDLEMTRLISSFLSTAKDIVDSWYIPLLCKKTKKKSSHAAVETVTMIQNRLQHIHQKWLTKSMTPSCDTMTDYPLDISREFESIYKQMTMNDPIHFNIDIVINNNDDPPSITAPMSILRDNKNKKLLNLETLSPEQLLDQLDGCVRQAFCAISLHDWIHMFDVMEAQIGDMYAWLPARKPSRTSRMSVSLSPLLQQQQQQHDSSSSSLSMAATSVDEVTISDIYTAIEGGRRSVVSPSAFSDDDLLLAFPHSIQYLYCLYYVIRHWVIQVIASNKIDVKTRVLRIEKFLQVLILHCNNNNNNNSSGSDGSIKKGGKIPGFVEYAIASALVSPQVRLFSKAWNDVAVQHGNANLDTLQNLLYQIQKMQPIHVMTSNNTTAEANQLQMVPSLGWIFERVLELKEGKTDMEMIHFEYRHYMVDFIHWLLGLQIELSKSKSHALSFSLTPTQELTPWKELRDMAIKETKKNGLRQRMVFGKLVADQMDKMKRDFKERDRIDKEWLSLQHKLQKKQVEQQIRQAKGSNVVIIPRLNSFLKGLRNSNNNNHHHNNNNNSNSNNNNSMIVDQSVKASTVIGLIGASTSIACTKRDFVFRIVTEEGGHYLFQGMSRDDMQDWMRQINAASREGAAKRQSVLVSEYIAEGLAQTNRHVQQQQQQQQQQEFKKGMTRKHVSSMVYGVALDELMQGLMIPTVVEKCICEIEKRGLEEVGIYRVAGTGSVVTALKNEFNKDVNKVDLSHPSWADINVVADAFKLFLRELPEPLLTYTYYHEFIHVSTLEDHDERVYLLKQVVKKLPISNYTLLKRIVEHFVTVTDFESTNHMYATNLAIVFGPTLLQPMPSPSSFATTMANLAHHQNIVKYLVLNYHYLFDVESEDIVAGPQ